MHVGLPITEIDKVEGRGDLNFLAINDLPLSTEGEVIDPKSIVSINFKGDKPLFPSIKPYIIVIEKIFVYFMSPLCSCS
jgi:metal transporter CNNM